LNLQLLEVLPSRPPAIKLPDLNTTDLDAAERIAAGTARSMGIDADLGMHDRGR
jgi:hypothetical protein